MSYPPGLEKLTPRAGERVSEKSDSNRRAEHPNYAHPLPLSRSGFTARSTALRPCSRLNGFAITDIDRAAVGHSSTVGQSALQRCATRRSVLRLGRRTGPASTPNTLAAFRSESCATPCGRSEACALHGQCNVSTSDAHKTNSEYTLG